MLKIHGVPVSVHTRKVIAAAILKDLAYESDPVIPFDPPEGWRTLSPTGLIPAITHQGFTLADSNAICAYLERIAPAPSLYPTDAQDFGRALWLEQYGTQVLFRQVVHPLFHQKIIRPHILKEGAPDEAAIRRIEESVAPQVLDYLEGQVAGAYLVGDALTIADIAIASSLLNYHYLGFRLDRGRHPGLAGLFDRLVRREPFATALAAEAPFAEGLGLDRTFMAVAA